MELNVRFTVIALLSLHLLVHYSSSQPHTEHMKQLAWFTPTEIEVVGKTFPHNSLEPTPSSSSPPLLPKEVADSIPFRLSKLPDLLQFFDLSPGSPMAAAMEHTLFHCEAKPLEGEIKTCATSFESMLDFVHRVFGPTTPQVEPLSTKHPVANLSTRVLHNYTIIDEPRPVYAPKMMISCHLMRYPYAVFYCHKPERESKPFQVKLRLDENNMNVDAVVVCHMDTSQWHTDHESFRARGIKHGSPVCHFMPANDLVWVPAQAQQGLDEKPNIAQA